MDSLATQSLTWLDYTLLAVLLLSVLVGLWRGLVFECLSLVGWLVAWWGAQWAAPQVAPWLAGVLGGRLPLGSPESSANAGAAFVLCFIGILIVWSLLAKLVRLLVHATPLSLFDRVLGAGFGLLRGAVLLLVVATVVQLTPLAQAPAWRASSGAHMLTAALATVRPLLPEGAARLLGGTNPLTGAGGAGGASVTGAAKPSSKQTVLSP
jgi:membrane protein required for colicin V production